LPLASKGQSDILELADRLEKRHILEDKLKSLMEELGIAINESLSDSDRIAAAIGEIRRAGYDVFLVLEATIGFNKRDEEGDEDALDEIAVEEPSPEPPPRRKGQPGKFRWTSQDQKFLRALKIAVDEEHR
jgi:hypothetical protein